MFFFKFLLFRNCTSYSTNYCLKPFQDKKFMKIKSKIVYKIISGYITSGPCGPKDVHDFPGTLYRANQVSAHQNLVYIQECYKMFAEWNSCANRKEIPTLAAHTLQQQICPHGRNSVSRLASEQTRHSSAVGSEGTVAVGVTSALGAGDTVGATAVLPATLAVLGSPSEVLSVANPVPSLRQDVKVLHKFGSGHRSKGV